jgi:uncharacterized protein YdhG (YjbR/CyaY superfamily)
MKIPETINEYISLAPKEARTYLKKIRSEVKSRLPKTSECISYRMPAFKDNKIFFYFAAFKKHIGVYPPVKDKKLKKLLAKYMNEKGNLSFPYIEDIPIKLIGDVAVKLWEEKNK